MESMSMDCGDVEWVGGSFLWGQVHIHGRISVGLRRCYAPFLQHLTPLMHQVFCWLINVMR